MHRSDRGCDEHAPLRCGLGDDARGRDRYRRGVSDVIVLDGGMGQELIRRTASTPTPLWSADAMLRHPEVVVETHRAFIDAGAQVITLNAYSATPCRLAPRGRGGEFESLQQMAIELAHRARTESGASAAVQVAGCLPPYEWSYRPELAPAFDDLVPHFARIVEQQAAGVDLFIAETMASAGEAAAAAVAAASAGLPVWVSWTLSDDRSGRLRSGESIDDAVAELDRRGVVPAAVLVNCSLPESIDAALPDLARVAERLGVPFGAYANGFGPIDVEYTVESTVDALECRSDLDPAGYLVWIDRWVDAGATVVGGCCEIGPDHIAAIAERHAPVRR